MNSYMILSTLDVRRKSNNREHHLIRFMAARMDSVYVVYRRECKRSGLARAIIDAFVPRASVFNEGNITYIAVNPALNHFTGMLEGLTTAPKNGQTLGMLKSWFGQTVAAVGIFKDISTVFFLFLFALLLTPRKIDMCAGLSPWGVEAGLLLRRLGRVKCVFYEDRDYEPGFVSSPLRKKWISWIENHGVKMADNGLSIGNRLADLRERDTGRRFPVITTGIELNKMHASTLTPEPCDKLIYVGNVSSWAGIELAINALASLIVPFPNLECLVIGAVSNAYLKYLKSLAQANGVEDRVSFTGAMTYSDAMRLLEQGGIGLATFQPTPLRTYAFPLKALDYMSAGLPIIATENTETADLVARHNCGLVVAYNNVDFANALSHLLSNKALYQELARSGRTAIVGYDWEQLLEKEYRLLQHTFHDAIKEPPDNCRYPF